MPDVTFWNFLVAFVWTAISITVFLIAQKHHERKRKATRNNNPPVEVIDLHEGYDH